MSLRARLVLVTWLAVAVIGGASAAIAYHLAKGQTEDLLDGQMQRVARIVAAGRAGSVRQDESAAALPPGYETEDDIFVVVRNAAGSIAYQSRDDIALPNSTLPGFGVAVVDGGAYEVLVTKAGDEFVTVAQSQEVRREIAFGAALSALLPVAFIIPILGLIITLVIRRQLRPLTRLSDAIARRPSLSLDPLPTDNVPEEILALVGEINQLLARQRTAIAREQRFLADAAHALRTPITALQLQVDVLDGSRDPDERSSRYAELRAGARRIVRLTGQLLALARQESDTQVVEEHSGIAEVLMELQAVYASVASDRGVSLAVKAPDNAQVRGSTHQLLLVFGNLLDNALRYAPRGSAIEIRSHLERGEITVDLTDEGPGLPAAELDRVFERFYRRSGDETEGNGLGLATVRAIAHQLKGRVWLENRVDRAGLLARVCLPLATASSGEGLLP